MAKTDIEYSVGLNTKQFDKEQKDLNNQFRKTKISAESFGKSSALSLSGMVAGAGVAVVAYKTLSAAIDQVSVGVEKFNIQQKAEATLEQTLKSTEYAAGLTSREIKNLASALQTYTVYGDESTIASSALLATFKQIGEDTFPRAQKAILDVSAAMGQDLKTSSVQVGKALNDPIQGMTAMSRVGITFTDVQKQMVKEFVAVNDIASAQGIILTELESQFGGVAAAQAKTFEGMNKQLDNYLGDIQESIGKGFSESMTKPLNDLLDSVINASPELQSLAESFGSIAGSLLSVPVNALTGWVDLFKSYSAGSDASLKDPLLKEQAMASTDLNSAIKASISPLKEQEIFSNFGGVSGVKELFLSAEKGNIESLRTISINKELQAVYNSTKDEVSRLNKAYKETYNVLQGGNKELKAKDVSADIKTVVEKIKFTEVGRSDTLDIGNAIPESERILGLEEAHRLVSQQRLEEQRAIDDEILKLQKEAEEQARQDRINFYENTIGVIGGSENAILGIHEAWASDSISAITRGLSNAASGVGGIFDSLGLADASGVTGIIGAGLGAFSSFAGLFDSDTTEVEKTPYESSSVTSRAQIVSSAPEIFNQNNSFNLEGCIVDETSLTDFLQNRVAPILDNATRGALA